MKVLKITKKNKESVLDEIIKTLKNRGVVALPTDTVFGLIARARDEMAVKKIFAMKKRPSGKPVSIFVSDIETAKKCAKLSPKNEKILKCLSETGFLEKITFILPLKDPALKTVTAGKKTIGVRISKDELIVKILKKIKEPLAQTSANPSGLPEARNAREVLDCFKSSQSKPDLLIDENKTLKNLSSTVIDLTKVPLKILREGVVSEKKIREVLSSRFFAG